MSNKQTKRKTIKRRLGDNAFIEFVTEGAGQVLYLSYEGQRIAKRGPGEKWRYLMPGYTVIGGEPGDSKQMTTICESGRLQ